MDYTYSCLFIFVFLALILTALFRCKLKCGTCDENYQYPSIRRSLGKFDHVGNEACMQCQRDFSSTRVCAPYCIRGEVI